MPLTLNEVAPTTYPTTETSRSQPALALGIYRFTLRLLQPLLLPAFTGNTWRGLFGHALRRAHCVSGAPICMGCPVLQTCSYALLFETPVPTGSEKMRKYYTAPHPYAMQVAPPSRETSCRAGDLIQVGITLFGRANHYLAAVVSAFEQAGRLGLGSHRARFVLDRVEYESSPGSGVWLPSGNSFLPPAAKFLTTPRTPPKIGLLIETPVRVQVDGRIVKPGDFQFHHFFRPLLRRIGLLQYFYSSKDFQPDFKALVRMSRDVSFLERHLSWFRWRRFSTRSQSPNALSGVLGSAVLDGDSLTPFWPYLWLGQFTHVGKGTAFGLGRYRLKTVPTANFTREKE